MVSRLTWNLCEPSFNLRFKLYQQQHRAASEQWLEPFSVAPGSSSDHGTGGGRRGYPCRKAATNLNVIRYMNTFVFKLSATTIKRSSHHTAPSTVSWSVITRVSLHLTSKQQKSYTTTTTHPACSIVCPGRVVQWAAQQRMQCRPGAGGGCQARVAPPRAPPSMEAVSCVLLGPHTGAGVGFTPLTMAH